MEFTKEMRGTHTLYLPAMLDQHFPLIRHALRGEGSQVRVLPPAGAGCAGENHFRPIEMALEDAGYPDIPVLALNVRERQFFPGLTLTPGLARKALSAILLGDMLQLCLMDAAPAEAEPGAAEALHRQWLHDLGPQIAAGKTCSGAHRRACCREIVKSFAALPRQNRPVVKIALAGEPYLKYCATGNRDLLHTLWAHGCKVWLSGFVGYGICVVDALQEQFGKNACGMARDYAQKLQRELLELADKAGLDHPSLYPAVKERAAQTLGPRPVDDAWYLGADVLDAWEAGYDLVAIPCAAGCLGPDRIRREVLEPVRQARPEARLFLLDCTAPQVEREAALAELLALLDSKRG